MDNRSKQQGTAADVTEASDPFALFSAWMAEAEASEPADPEAMAVATVDANGLPNVRTIFPQRRRRPRFRLLYELRERQGQRACRQPQGRAPVALQEPGAADPHARAGRAGNLGGSRRLFRHASPREPHRGLRVTPVATACLTCGA